MAYLFDGSGDRVNFTKSAGATDLSTFSVSSHYVVDAAAAAYREIAWSGGSWSDNFGWFIQQDGGLDRMCLVTNWSTTRARWSVVNAPDDTWTNDIWTYDYGSTSNDPICYRNGSSISITENSTPAGTARPTNDDNTLTIGAYDDGSGEYWLGKIAEFAIWNRILTAGEAAIVGKGYSALFVPNGLVFYAPMIRNLPDLKGGGIGTATNAVVTPHPRIIYPYGDPTGVHIPTPGEVRKYAR